MGQDGHVTLPEETVKRSGPGAGYSGWSGGGEAPAAHLRKKKKKKAGLSRQGGG